MPKGRDWSDSVPPLVRRESFLRAAPMSCGRGPVRGRFRRRNGPAGRSVDGGGVGELDGRNREAWVEHFPARTGAVR